MAIATRNRQLDTVEWDRSLHAATMEVNGVTVPFRSATDAGDDVVLWRNHEQTKLAARVEDASFTAADVEEEVDRAFEDR